MHSFRWVEEPLIAAAQRQVGSAKHAGQDAVSNSPVGRLKGNPSTIVNVRLPLTLLTRLDRYLDQLEVETGLKANRGMITRRALELFLETQESSNAK